MRAQLQPRALAALSILAIAFVACGPGAATTAPTTAGGGATTVPATAGATTEAGSSAVAVTVQEFAVLPEPGSAAAGDVTFKITNKGPDDEHEFVVVRTDLAPDALPTDSTGAVDEEGAGIEVVDEVEEIPVGSSEDLTVNLTAGKYVLICNIYDADEKEAHYKMGMHVAFTVN